MRDYQYVILDPTGNLTALVTEPAEKADEPELTRRLLAESEQVAYLEPPERPEAVARSRYSARMPTKTAAYRIIRFFGEDRKRFIPPSPFF